jgi:hypothetical protein
MPDDNQLNKFVSALDQAVGDAVVTPNDLLVPFPTALSQELNADLEKKMLDHAFKMFDQLNRESGREATIQSNWFHTVTPPTSLCSAQGIGPSETFMGKQARFDAMFYNDVSWRPYVLGGIFRDSNLVVPLSRRIARQMIARAQNAFFGSDQWVSVDPVPTAMHESAEGWYDRLKNTLVTIFGKPLTPGEQEEALADRIERFCQYKLKESDSVTDKRRIIQRALILGQCPVKTSYVVRDQIYNTEAQVLTSIEGTAIPGQDGNPITEKDQSLENADGSTVLARDGVTPFPDAPIWTKQMIPRRQVLFEGAKSEPIYYKDFLCPQNAADVQTAECVIHLYDKPVMEFVDLVVKRGMVDASTDARLQATRKIVTLVKQLATNTSDGKAAMSQDQRPNENYLQQNNQCSSPVAEFAEFYMWYDANGDGIAENIMLIADRKTKMPIFYDYVANVTTDGLRPIEIVRINPVEGRWYGLGIMELFESYQTVVDLMVNRWNFSQSRAGRIDFWDPTLTLEGSMNPNLRLNWGGTYTTKPGAKVEDVLKSVYLADTKFESLQTMTQFFTQLAMNESGVLNANDNYVAGMEQAKLATGINQIERSGEELFQPIIGDLKVPLEKVISREIAVILANMNPEEVFTYLKSDTLQIDKLTPEDVANLKFKVQIELTKNKNQQDFQASLTAAQLIEKFYTLPPQIQEKVAPFYRKQLHAIDPHTEPDVAIVPMGIQMQPPNTGTPAKVGESNTYQGNAPQPASVAA